MLRITIEDEFQSTTLTLEGNAGGSWVEQLERCWRYLRAFPEFYYPAGHAGEARPTAVEAKAPPALLPR